MVKFLQGSNDMIISTFILSRVSHPHSTAYCFADTVVYHVQLEAPSQETNANSTGYTACIHFTRRCPDPKYHPTEIYRNIWLTSIQPR